LGHGLAFDADLRRKITGATNAHAITAAGALVAALSALGVKRIGFASPYVSQLNDQGIEFLSQAGFETASRADLDEALTSAGQGEMSPEAIFHLAMRANCENCEAIVLACTDLRAVESIERIEHETGKPVVTSNQAIIFELVYKFSGLKSKNLPGRIFELV
jgi:maleate cis-trans isomerase